jgi:uncharacterized YigZ family protein
MNTESYLTIANETTSEFKDRGSKFYGFSFPIQSSKDVKTNLKQLKDCHPKAIHFCYAYRIGILKNEFRASDDGEPSGSAGKPILSQIDSLNLTNVLVVVVRYWGGVLLGVPGLINAYKTTAKESLSIATIVEKDLMQAYELKFDYTILDQIMRCIKQVDGEIVLSSLGLFCEYKIVVPIRNQVQFLNLLKNYYELKVIPCS